MSSSTQIVGQADSNAAQTAGNGIPAVVTAPITPNTFVFWAGFNGTNNMSSNPAYSGDVQTTAIGAMWGQIDKAALPNVVAKEYDGVGTPNNGGFPASVNPTSASITIARSAYNDFAQQAKTWLQTHPGGEVTTMMASFSRGGIAAAIFSQMLFKEGLVYKGEVLVSPGQVGVSANLIISGVNSGSNGDVAFAPNVQNSVQVIAANEYRVSYEQDIYGGTTKDIWLSGNHGDLGSFYPGGLGAMYLQDYTDFFNAVNPCMAGTVLPSRQDHGGPYDIHAEVVTGLTTLQNLATKTLADGRTNNTHNIRPLGTSEVTSTGDKYTYVDYNGDTIVMERVGGVLQSITRIPRDTSFDGNPTTPVVDYQIGIPTSVVDTSNADGTRTVVAKNAAGVTVQSTTTLSNGDLIQTNYVNGAPNSVTKTITASDGTKTVGLYDATGNVLQSSVATHVVNNGAGLITVSEIAQDGNGVLVSVVETVQDNLARTSTTTQLTLEQGTVIGKTVTTYEGTTGTKTQNKFDANDVLQSNVIQFSSGEVDVTSYSNGQPISVTKNVPSGNWGHAEYLFDGTGTNLQTATLFEVNTVVDSGGTIITTTKTVMDGTGATTYARVDSQKVVASVNGQLVEVTYTYGADGTLTAHVNSINGQAPLNPVAADAAFNKITPGQLVSGDLAGTDVAGAVTVNDAVHPSGSQTLARAIPTAIDALMMINAIQRGDGKQLAASGLHIGASLSPQNTALNSTSSIVSGLLSLQNMSAALERGDGSTAALAATQTVAYVASAFASNSSVAASISTTLNGNVTTNEAGQVTGNVGVLAYANLIYQIDKGNRDAAAVAAADIILMEMGVASVPVIGWAVAIVNLTQAIMSSHSTPEIWGNARAQWDGFTTVTHADGSSTLYPPEPTTQLVENPDGTLTEIVTPPVPEPDPGLNTAQQTYDGLLNYLKGKIDKANTANPSFQLGLVANRLPSITFRDYGGFQLVDVDPVTGQQRNADIHYDCAGRLLPEYAGRDVPANFANYFVQVALARGAIAPLWEVQTAALQTQVGDPLAGLSEVANDGFCFERRAA